LSGCFIEGGGKLNISFSGEGLEIGGVKKIDKRDE